MSKAHNQLINFVSKKYFMILQKNYLRFKQLNKFTTVTITQKITILLMILSFGILIILLKRLLKNWKFIPKKEV